MRTTLAEVGDASLDDYVEAPQASCALAAAEIVAAALGAANDDLPETVEPAADALRPEAPELRALAVRAVARVRDSSELRELWDEAGAEPWLSVVDDLTRRLSA